MDNKNGFGRVYDFILTIFTVILLAAMGAVYFYGTIYSFNKSRINPEWTQTIDYYSYIYTMYVLTMPLTLILLLVMALCIPRRIIPRHFLLPISGAILFSALSIALTVNVFTAISMVILFAAIVQIYVAYAVIRGSNYLVFEKQSTIEKLGSTFLHLGILILVLALTVFQTSSLHLAVFWTSTALTSAGSLFIFYPKFFTSSGQKNSLRQKKGALDK